MPEVIDIHELAARTGSTAPDVRIAAGKLFAQLVGEGPDLAKALIEACSESGLDPNQVMKILTVMAEDLDEQPEADAPRAVTASLQTLGTEALARIKTGSAQARELATSLDLEAIKADGKDLVNWVKGEMAAIDLAAVKDRAVEAGQTIVRKTRNAASRASEASDPATADRDNG